MKIQDIFKNDRQKWQRQRDKTIKEMLRLGFKPKDIQKRFALDENYINKCGGKMSQLQQTPNAAERKILLKKM